MKISGSDSTKLSQARREAERLRQMDLSHLLQAGVEEGRYREQVAEYL